MKKEKKIYIFSKYKISQGFYKICPLDYSLQFPLLDCLYLVKQELRHNYSIFFCLFLF